ncbi:MAG: hypothetical protein AAGD38_23350 [Acidobacteriota bacterium]
MVPCRPSQTTASTQSFEAHGGPVFLPPRKPSTFARAMLEAPAATETVAVATANA